MEKVPIPWSVPVGLEEIPETGLHREMEAPADARAAIAKLANLRELPQLLATFDLTRRGAGVLVRGRVQARVGQTCVVTLEPIENAVDEAIEVEFAPRSTDAEKRAAKEIDGDEPPEALIDGRLDLGALATEFFLLGIDSYPRKPGAEFAPPKAAETGDHPFAALAALKKRSDFGPS